MILIAIEGMLFALLIASYFYYRMRYAQWPPPDAGPPSLTLPLSGLALLLVSCYPMWRIHMGAPTQSPEWLERMLLISGAPMLIICTIRFYEFSALHTSYWVNSYGSITWAIYFTHSVDYAVSVGETFLMAHYCHNEKLLDTKHRSDLQLNSIFYYFLVIAWAIILVVLLLGGRLL